MNVCGFRNPNDMLCPEDGFGCTVDACRPGASFDSSGCVHEPQDSMCSDGFDCTDGLCRPGPGTGTSGCVHIPHDELCPTSGGLECAVSVCAAGEAGAVVDSRSGCGLTYGPCSLGGLCDTDGHCTAAARCGLMLPECDDGNPCNGVESCIAGFCGVVAPLECDLGGLCRSYCTTTGCGVRTLLPGGVICALSSP